MSIFDELSDAGIGMVIVNYNGMGDEGFIEEVIFHPGGSIPELEGAVENYIYENLPDGWEINEGSFGRTTIYVAERRAEFAHNERYEASRPEPFTLED